MTWVNSSTLIPDRRQRQGRRLADFLDTEQWQAGDGTALRMSIPFGERPARGDHETGLGSGTFERLRRPLLQRALHRGFMVLAAEKSKQSVAMMRQIGMQPRPTAVAAAV
jgi:hypothetical protein